MAEEESDLETDRLEVDLETLFDRYCSSKCTLQSKEYCSEFCKLVEEHTGRWQVPLPQLKVLRTALCCFSKATAAFPDDCQHVYYAVSSLALSFFELMLFFGKEEFQEDPLRDILDSFQDCYSSLLRHSNVYLQQVKQVMKDGGPWESPVLQAILREAALPQAEVEEYVSSEVPVFFELRVRYLQACERVQEALALAKSCLEHPDTGKHLYFHQAYLTCLYKASLHEHLHKEMAEIDGRDAVEIICNTESVEKDELLLSLCKAFLTQQLHNGDMYYIWDLVFIWSRLHLRAYPSKQGFLAECRQLMSSATNIRAIFPFIKVVTAEMVSEGVQLCVELCAHALKSDPKADPLTRSLVYKTIAFLLPRDLEVCRACALLVFLLERSVEAYRTVCLLYTHPDEEPHPHHNLIRPNVRFHILQVLKEGLCFDPEFWNLLTLRTHCLELMSDKAMKAALSEMKDEETEEEEEWIPNDYMHEDCMPHTDTLKSHTNSALQTTKKTLEEKPKVEPEGREALPETTEDAPVRRRRKRRRRRRRHGSDDVDSADDPDIKFSVKPAHSDIKYTLRRKHTNPESMAKLPANRQREYLSRHVKNKIMKRRGRKPRWLLLEMARQAENTIPGGKRHALRTISMLELSYPENDIFMEQEEERIHPQHSIKEENGLENHVNMEPSSSLHGETHVEPPTETDIKPLDCPSEKSTLVEATPEVEGPEVEECPLQLFHSYSKPPKGSYAKEPEPSESTRTELEDDSTEMEQIPSVDDTHTQGEGDRRVPEVLGKRYALLRYHCGYCQKDFKGGNVVRHSLSHLKGRRRRCIFCGKRFRQYDLAKQHVLEHIEELRTAAPNSKELGSTKTKKKKQRTATPNSEMAPAVNGSTEPLVKETQSSENLTQLSAPTPTDQPPKAKSRKAKPEVSQESRIIQNLRTLIKKTQSLHKRQTVDNHTNHEPELLKDEQVIVKDKLVIVREAPVKEGEGRENGVGMKYHLCPAEGCDKVFLRIGQTLIRHAVNNHIGDPAVLEQTFQWGKGKCVLCTRYLFNRQHYRDHMKFHDNPLKQMCVHLDCSHRFKTPQDLKEHMDTHKPLQPQCQFPGCEQIFSGLPMLYDHEWRHYTQPQPKDETEQIAPTQHSTDAPWKQRVKSQEVSLHGWKGYKETASPETKCLDPPKNSTPDPGERAVSEAVTEGSEGRQKPELDPSSKVSPVGTPDTHFSDPIPRLINGHEEDKIDKGPEKEVPVFTAIPSASPQLGAQNPPDLLCLNPAEPVDIKEVEGIVTLSERTQFMAEPSIPPPKTFKLEDPTHAPVAKAPFIRPPPSTYLDEQALCMPKRRKAFEATSSSSNSKNGVVAGGKQTQRQRCSKCFSSFSSPEELQKHLSLNTCSSLFSFDSDEDS